MSRIDEKELVLTVDETLAEVPQGLKALGARLLDPSRLSFTYKRHQVNSGQILGRAAAAGLTILDVTTKEAALEEIFLKLTSGSH
jgi:ABC-2 type transport system ATP-binding protein